MNLRLKEVPAMWYRGADVPLPPVLLQGPMPEVKVGSVVGGDRDWLAGWLIDGSSDRLTVLLVADSTNVHGSGSPSWR